MNIKRKFLATLGLLGLAATGFAQSGAVTLPWHDKDGPLVRNDGSIWRPELQLELEFPKLASPEPVRIGLPFDGTWVEVDLVPHSIRTADFKLFERGADGELVEIEAPPSRLFHGSIVDLSLIHI